MQIVEFIVLSLCIGAFAIQVAISDLSDKFKRIFGLQQPYKFNSIITIQFWRKFLGNNTSMVLSPFILVVILLGNIHKLLSELLSCPYCTVFWLMLGVNLWFLDLPIMDSIIYAPMGLVGVTILDRLMR